MFSPCSVSDHLKDFVHILFQFLFISTFDHFKLQQSRGDNSYICYSKLKLNVEKEKYNFIHNLVHRYYLLTI